jgi:hypothetical protein
MGGILKSIVDRIDNEGDVGEKPLATMLAH